MEHLVWDKNLTPQDFLVLQSLADDIKAHSASSSNGHSQCHTDSSSKAKQTATNGANGDALRRKPVPNGNGNGVANGRQNQNATKLNDADNAMQANKAMSMLPSKP